MAASHLDGKKKMQVLWEMKSRLVLCWCAGGWLDGFSHPTGDAGCGSTRKSSGWQSVFLSMPAWQSLDAAQVLLYPYLGPDILFAPTSFTDLPRHSLETQ